MFIKARIYSVPFIVKNNAVDIINFFKTSFYTWQIIHFTSVESTNKLLSQNRTLYKPFTCVWADEQTAGRGRLDRRWNAVAGKDLTFSLLIPLAGILQKNWSNITQTMAVAIVKTIEDMKVASHIKWPNDVLINGKKVCGILSEVCSFPAIQGQDQQQSVSVAVVGIGINLNSDEKDMMNIDQKATSLLLETQKKHDREKTLHFFLIHISECLKHLEQGNFDYLRKFIQRRLTLQGKRSTIEIGTHRHTGMVVGINNDGSLCFRCDNCGNIKVHSGELFFV